MDCQVQPELMDDDYDFIIYEFMMNYSVESIRNGYWERKKKESQKVDNDLLLELGYNDDDLLNKRELEC